MGKLPIKFRLVQIVFNNEGISKEELLQLLKEDYPQDRYVTEKGVEDYLISLKAVGMVELSDVTVDEFGKIKQFYRITKYGASRMKYIN